MDIAAYEDAGASPVASLAVSDRALVLARWRSIKPNVEPPVLRVENSAWMSAAMAERTIAKRMGRLPFVARDINVRDIGDGNAPCGSFLTWREPLDRSTLRLVRKHVDADPECTVRIYGRATAQLAELEEWPLKRLRIYGDPKDVRMESVTELHLESAVDTGRALQCFPNVSTLRLAARGLHFDGATATATNVRVLDLSGLARASNLRALPSLRHLRLVRVAAVPDLTGLKLRTLTVDDVAVASLDALQTMVELEQLELRALWQLRIEDAKGLLALPNLVRGSIDIGGRRKNIEIYRHARWAYPWPFEFMYELSRYPS
ncbi:MAG: leucine-rich repeat domain-containing protein [Candidatus Eremiobacteraeota bacterium]|nr:leucine-rich repeat domain-containing protein [Candidatus Eremiobacteraeota bacterium]